MAQTFEPGADGKPQAIIPGAERISDRQLAERRMGGAIQPKARQRPADIGLFDTAARDQGDLFAQTGNDSFSRWRDRMTTYRGYTITKTSTTIGPELHGGRGNRNLLKITDANGHAIRDGRGNLPLITTIAGAQAAIRDELNGGANDPKARIWAMMNSGVFHGDLCDLVRERFNCAEVDITDEGAIWIAKPQAGHWLNDDAINEFADWAEDR